MNNLKEIKLKITPEMGDLIIERLNILSSTANSLGSTNANMIKFNTQLISYQIAGEFRTDEEGKVYREEANKLIDLYNKSVKQAEENLTKKDEVKEEVKIEDNKEESK